MTTTTIRWCACCSDELPVNATRAYCVECGDPSRVEFEVEVVSRQTFATFDEAVARAVSYSLSRGGEPVNVDALCYSRAAAFSLGCLDDYDADPEASVTSRVTIRATGLGRIA